MRPNHKKTLVACYIGYIVQAIVNNFVPLLFMTFHRQYGIPLARITLPITLNFLIQLGVDLLSAGFIDRIGYRASVVAAHLLSAAGLVLLAVLPDRLPDAYTGILIAVAVYAVGGGLLEVLISPIAEACPTEHKEQTMSLLHSFYCWGHVGVVLLSTGFFALWGIGQWKWLSLLWAVVPLLNLLLFVQAPLYTLTDAEKPGMGIRRMCSQGCFWLLLVMMLCAGAGEQAVSQWASAFAEKGLGISKALGDLAGPMAFALMMGLSRLLYGQYGSRLELRRCMVGSALLCIAAYLCIVLIPVPLIGLLGCAVCGFSVGIFWPGTYSLAAATLKGGGTTMFALLALAGDLGCAGGPTLAGLVSGARGNNLRTGILAATIFPAVMLLCLGSMRKKPTHTAAEKTDADPDESAPI